MAVRDFPQWLRDQGFDSQGVQNLFSSLFDRQNIDLQQELTSVASGDEIGIFDVSETGQVKFKKATVSNIGAAVLAAGGSPTFANLTVTGLLDISGASAGQIKFPATQNPSSNVNTLDDYEEGTWTPVVNFGGGMTGITYSNQAGRYTKIGRAVNISAVTSLTSKGSSTGAAQIGGLPFTSSGTGGEYVPLNLLCNALAAGSVTQILADVIAADDEIRCGRYSAGSFAGLTDADFTNTTLFEVAGVYFA